jgi:transposase InsO family protein
LLTDNGSEFPANSFTDTLGRLGVQQRRIRPRPADLKPVRRAGPHAFAALADAALRLSEDQG